MSRGRATLLAYRYATGLYPKAFRDDYRPDLIALMADQLDDEPTWRVAVRSAVDLAITLPARHLEAHMDRPPTPFVPVLFGAIAIASLIVGVIVGHPLVLLACAAAGAVASVVALVAAHRQRPLTSARPASVYWWKLLLAGVTGLVALVAVTTATGELAEGGWFLAMVLGLAAVLVMSAGVVLGIVHLASRSTRRASPI